MIYRKNKSSGKFRITKQNAAIKRKNNRHDDKSASFPYFHTLNKNNNLKRKHYGKYQKRHPRRCLRKSRNNSRCSLEIKLLYTCTCCQSQQPSYPKAARTTRKICYGIQFLRIIKPFIRIGYKEFTGEKSAYNAAMSYMLKKVILNKGKEKMFLTGRIIAARAMQKTQT